MITGCTKGLGQALSVFFAEQGAVVAGCGRNPEALARLSQRLGLPHAFTAVDVAEEAEVARWAKAVLEAHGAPDLVINNAAIINRNASLWELAGEEVEALFRVNVLGVTHVIRHFLPAMLARGRGVVVNVSSGWGRSTSAEVATYCASKWAIEGLTQALAQDLQSAGSSVAAVAVNPGIIDTEMLRSCFGAAASHYPDAKAWVRRAGPFLLSLGTKDNGRSLDVAGVPTT